MTPARPRVSFGLFHDAPESESPAAAVVSMSVNSYDSTEPSATPARAKIPRSRVTSCSRLTLTPAHLPDGGRVGRPADRLCQRHGVVEAPHASARQNAGHRDLARLAPNFVPMFDFPDPLEIARSADRAPDCRVPWADQRSLRSWCPEPILRRPRGIPSNTGRGERFLSALLPQHS
jgi:hypothetical protein